MIDKMAVKIDSYVKNLLNNPVVKVIGAETGIIIQIFNELKLAVITVIVLVMFDLFFGLLAAYKYGCISSWKMRESVHKLLFYIIVISIGAAIQVIWGIPWLKEAFVGLIVTTELLSIIENIEISFPKFLTIRVLDRHEVAIVKTKIKHKSK